MKDKPATASFRRQATGRDATERGSRLSSSGERSSIHLAELTLSAKTPQTRSKQDYIQATLYELSQLAEADLEQGTTDDGRSYGKMTLYQQGDSLVRVYHEASRKTDQTILLQGSGTAELQELFTAIRHRLPLDDWDYFVQGDDHLAIYSHGQTSASDPNTGTKKNRGAGEIHGAGHLKTSIARYLEDIRAIVVTEGFRGVQLPLDVPIGKSSHECRRSFLVGDFIIDVLYGKKHDSVPDMIFSLKWRTDVLLDYALNDVLLAGMLIRPHVASMSISSLVMDVPLHGFGINGDHRAITDTLTKKRSKLWRSDEHEPWKSCSGPNLPDLPDGAMLCIGRESDKDYHIVVQKAGDSSHLRLFLKRTGLRELGVHSLKDFFVRLLFYSWHGLARGVSC